MDVRRPGAGTGARVAVQGDPGCFSHAAAVSVFETVDLIACPDFSSLFEAVQGGSAAWGVVPVENALAGAVSENLDLLFSGDLVAVGEAYVRVELCLSVRPESGQGDEAVAGLSAAASHPVALRQCRRFFSVHPHIRPVVAADTAGSIRELMAGDASWDAAIGPALAAELYGARVLLRGIEDDPRNFTRFLVVGRTASPVEGGVGGPGPDGPRVGHPLTGQAKASLVFTLPHRPGALHAAIGIFARRGLDLTRLESRPIVGRPWEYSFHADVRGSDRDALEDGICALEQIAPQLRRLGVYPEAAVPAV